MINLIAEYYGYPDQTKDQPILAASTLNAYSSVYNQTTDVRTIGFLCPDTGFATALKAAIEATGVALSRLEIV